MTKLEDRVASQGLLLKDILEKQYLQEFKGCTEIAKLLGVTAMTIHKHLKKYNIPTRDFREAGKLVDKVGSKNPIFGKHLSEELKKEKSRHLKELIAREGHWCKGKKASEETKKRISTATKGSGNPRWKGGRRAKTDAYIEIYAPDHPNRNKGRNSIYEHQMVMEKHIGRHLLPGEVVHHINGDTRDNRIENLQLLTSSEHLRLHLQTRPKRAYKKHNIKRTRSYLYNGQKLWSKNYTFCRKCGTNKVRHNGNGLCVKCYNYELKHGLMDNWKRVERKDAPR